MSKLYQFFLAHFAYKYDGVTDDLTVAVRERLAREKTHADLRALRDASSSFITEIDMELERRGPEYVPHAAQALAFDEVLRLRLDSLRRGR
jgi:hypothetical protein